MNINNLCPNCMTEYEGNICPHCGRARGDKQDNSHALKPYTILSGKYLVGNVIGEGGFGITYIGFDLNLEVKIAIKEYYPNGFVTRESEVTSVVTGYTANDPERFRKWKDSFVREARNLAKFSNLPGIVHVRDFFQENNTAYIIMEYVEGETLKTYLKNRKTPMTVEEVLELMEPVIKSLSRVHDGGIIHRDISPDNIMIQEGGDIKLIDFGAAREFEAGNERSMSVLLKPGYAPEEQYRTRGEQGPWTDVYALSATIYRCITGIKPVESMERMRADELKKPSEIGVNISPETENALMTGMAVYAESRIRDMNALHSALYKGGITAKDQQSNNTMSGNASIVSSQKNVTTGINTASGNGLGDLLSDRRIKIAALVTAVLLLILLFVVVKGVNGNRADTDPEPNEPTSEAVPGADNNEDIVSPTGDNSDQGDDEEASNPDDTKKNPDDEEEPEPMSDKEKYMHEYEEIVGEYWNDPDHRGWDINGIEIVNLNENENSIPEVMVIWDVAKDGEMGQTLFGVDCEKNYHAITSSSVYGYTFGIYKGSDGSTLAYTSNVNNSYYLVDSEDSKAFSLQLTNDDLFDCSIRDEYVGRVPEVYNRASQTPAGWSPDDSTYYRATWDEWNTVMEALIDGREWVDHYYTDCFISNSYDYSKKDNTWEEAWNKAWDNYAENWDVKD